MNIQRSDATSILNDYVQSESLRKHCLGVASCMEWQAKKLGLSDTEIEAWWICGLLHDFDYEKYPNPTSPDGHPYAGQEILRKLGISEEILEAIMGHALYTGVPRNSLMSKYLFAVDELSGLVTASVWVRPDKSIFNLEMSSVKKKFKDKAFARGCNRDDIKLGAEELQVELDLLIQEVIDALRINADILGLSGV
jgi:putative nucleotidyltransferase with HDIG domain